LNTSWSLVVAAVAADTTEAVEVLVDFGPQRVLP
jgi:hypothetical protein